MNWLLKIAKEDDTYQELSQTYHDLYPQTPNYAPKLKPPSQVYRGMSMGELDNIIQDGFIKSDGRFNLRGEDNLTLFADEPRRALGYASGFSNNNDLPTYEKPKYVIEVQTTPDMRYERGYVVTTEQVPAAAITRVWEIKPKSGEFNYTNPMDYTYREVTGEFERTINGMSGRNELW